MHKIFFTKTALENYKIWETTDKTRLEKINALLADCEQHPYTGMGKPTPLKQSLTGFWSRRIDSINRLIYTVRDNEIIVVQC